MAFLDDNGLLYFWQKLKTALAGKVDVVSGKGLSTNDYSTADKTKLNNIAAGAEVNVINSVKVNNTAVSITDKTVNITVPTNNNQLTNGAGYQTASQVQTLIANATHLKRLKVDSLPTTGDVNTIYMVLKSSGATGNIYDEYMYIDSAWELIGNSSADLSGYVKDTDTITNAEIDTIVAG